MGSFPLQVRHLQPLTQVQNLKQTPKKREEKRSEANNVILLPRDLERTLNLLSLTFLFTFFLFSVLIIRKSHGVISYMPMLPKLYFPLCFV
ncbi:hypothetical protein LOK49_LG10G00590 [Camellia lanceoleosa]|uniref:Uncharacterized protein n=1 Tax=Camellia lanceoleosa TaxID=1840588 RepID=A0ACC0GCF0_9ERIC|nr:hypothetical protein LOK49_LG10G00590 [Camellia lanceoleosa]